MKSSTIPPTIRTGILALAMLFLASCSGYLEIFPIAALNPSKLNNPLDPTLNPNTDSSLVKEWTFDNGLNGFSTMGDAIGVVLAPSTWMGKSVLKLESTKTSFSGYYSVGLSNSLGSIKLTAANIIVYDVYISPEAISNSTLNFFISLYKTQSPYWRNIPGLAVSAYPTANWYRITYDMKDWLNGNTSDTEPLNDLSVPDTISNQFSISGGSTFGPFYFSRVAIYRSSSTVSVGGVAPLLPKLINLQGIELDRQVKISWDLPSDPAITKVRITWPHSAVGPAQPLEVAASAGTVTIGSLNSNSSYKFSLCAEDDYGNTSASTEITIATKPAAAGELIKSWKFDSGIDGFTLGGLSDDTVLKATQEVFDGRNVMRIVSTKSLSSGYWAGVNHSLDGLALAGDIVFVVKAYIPATMTSRGSMFNVHDMGAAAVMLNFGCQINSGAGWHRLVYDMANCTVSELAKVTEMMLSFCSDTGSSYGPIYIYSIEAYKKGSGVPSEGDTPLPGGP